MLIDITLKITPKMALDAQGNEKKALFGHLDVYKRQAFDSTGLVEISIPENVTIIGDFAFENCQSLESVIGGKGLQSLKSQSQNQNKGYVFGGCTKLATIDLIGRCV